MTCREDNPLPVCIQPGQLLWDRGWKSIRGDPFLPPICATLVGRSVDADATAVVVGSGSR